MKTGLYVYAIRYMQDDEKIEIGAICRRSYDWDFEHDCSRYETDGAQLPGTCGLCLHDIDEDSTAEEIKVAAQEALKDNISYCGTPVIIGGNRWTGGNDRNEVVIEDAEMIALIV